MNELTTIIANPWSTSPRRAATVGDNTYLIPDDNEAEIQIGTTCYVEASEGDQYARIMPLATRNSDRDKKIVALAVDKHVDSVGFDDSPEVSESSENGAWVQAWVWVDFAGTEFDKRKNEDLIECSKCFHKWDKEEGFPCPECGFEPEKKEAS